MLLSGGWELLCDFCTLPLSPCFKLNQPRPCSHASCVVLFILVGCTSITRTQMFFNTNIYCIQHHLLLVIAVVVTACVKTDLKLDNRNFVLKEVHILVFNRMKSQQSRTDSPTRRGRSLPLKCDAVKLRIFKTSLKPCFSKLFMRFRWFY